jgi:hypothetical protein
MKKYLKSIKQSADYSAMESRDHYKNGANPKNLKIKIQFSKNSN